MIVPGGVVGHPACWNPTCDLVPVFVVRRGYQARPTWQTGAAVQLDVARAGLAPQPTACATTVMTPIVRPCGITDTERRGPTRHRWPPESTQRQPTVITPPTVTRAHPSVVRLSPHGAASRPSHPLASQAVTKQNHMISFIGGCLLPVVRAHRGSNFRGRSKDLGPWRRTATPRRDRSTT